MFKSLGQRCCPDNIWTKTTLVGQCLQKKIRMTIKEKRLFTVFFTFSFKFIIMVFVRSQTENRIKDKVVEELL